MGFLKMILWKSNSVYIYEKEKRNIYINVNRKGISTFYNIAKLVSSKPFGSSKEKTTRRVVFSLEFLRRTRTGEITESPRSRA